MAERGRLGFQTTRKGGGGGPLQVVLHIARLPPPARAEGPEPCSMARDCGRHRSTAGRRGGETDARNNVHPPGGRPTPASTACDLVVTQGHYLRDDPVTGIG